MNLLNIEKMLLKKKFYLKHYENIDSTMIEIKNIFNKKKDKYFIIADSQTKGIGRRGRKWHSPKGNVYFSLIKKMSVKTEDHFIYNAAATLSICEIIDSVCGIKSKIKWPNDILVNKKKISGIITEIINHNNINFIILGVGINLISSPNIKEYKTTHINTFNKKIDRNIIIERFIKNFFQKLDLIKKNKYNYIKIKYKNKLLYLNEIIGLEIDNKPTKISGEFMDINYDGSMIVKIDGSKKQIYSARIINDSY